MITEAIGLLPLVKNCRGYIPYPQCRNRLGRQGAGGRVPPETSDREIFADVSGKRRQGKKGKEVKMDKKRRKIVNGKVENWNWK